uniref:Trichohyalin-plectin-homology domain-containing protein n=1 Tax=Globisporangium ultimum (strain ATCC 200006 / CBS 805.95 / DAOM BR144) TaxID=431595 RepID=K3X6X8_GLOUD
MQEEMKSDKRHAVADALATKLKSKYAKQDPQFADSIALMVNRLLHSHQRILESDIVTLEAVVKKMSLERQSQRSNSATGSTGGSTHVNSTRPGGEVSHQMKVNSSSEQSASNTNGGRPRSNHHSLVSELKNQDEWVLLNALTLVEVESEKEREKTKILEKRQLQRAWLDAQQAEKAAYRELEKREGQLQYQHQMRDISNWQESESMKKQHQLDQIMKVRRERDEQLRQQKLKLEQTVLKKKQEDAAEVERVQRELKRLDDEAQRRRIQEHERMKKLQIENSAVQREKGHIKFREQQEDVKLMEVYARRLAREDEERMQALQGKLKQRDHTQHKIAESIQMQMRQKTLEDEKRAEEYQRKKDEVAIQKEREAQEKRRKEALERQQFLHVQRAQKNQRERQEIDDDLSFAEQYHGEARAAIATQKRQLSYVRQQNRAFQEQLVLQMEEQRKGQPMSPLHLPRTLMNSRERNINAKLLQKLEQPEITQKVLQKLSPSKDVTRPIITTTFY